MQQAPVVPLVVLVGPRLTPAAAVLAAAVRLWLHWLAAALPYLVVARPPCVVTEPGWVFGNLRERAEKDQEFRYFRVGSSGSESAGLSRASGAKL